MTHVERKRFARYVRTMANTLGLRDWTLNLQHDEPDTKDAWASVACVYGRRIANLWFAHGFEDLSPAEQRHTIVHELLHIHFDRVRSLADGTLPGLLGAAAYAAFEAAQREVVEHGVDAVADALASALPLPE